jgi:hypothetical protein
VSSSYSFFTSAVGGDEWSALRSGRALSLGKGLLVPTVQEAGWDPQLVFDAEVKGTISCPCWGSSLDRPVIRSVAIHYTD